MKSIQQYIIKEDKFPAPDFNNMTPPVVLLELMSGKTLEEVLPKCSAGWAIHGVYNQYKDKFPNVDQKLLNLVKK